ncbi:aspartate aminotransferase family protein [Balneola sp. MJW-20]|uniref:aspartate aminotransferase family protein n=1 Tax=Gracilimonas aurantiaca TaxID=3234185 RepID=UPI003466E14E
MKLFDVYPLFDVEPVKGEGNYVIDAKGNKYLDFYGGHAVISVGHGHPHYVKRIEEQLHKIGFYSNSVGISLQRELADKLGMMSGYEEWNLFLCNSGAEANENALKLASYANGRSKLIAFEGAFHGRTSLAVLATDNPRIKFPVNEGAEIIRCRLNDIEMVKKELLTEEVCAVIIESIQGVGGIKMPSDQFLKEVRDICTRTGTMLIIDEVQSGFGRSGKFFAHQHSGVKPDLISIAKGMGNGFPVGGVLVSPEIKAEYGLLGTTFGGNHLACAASLAVLEILEKDDLIGRASELGEELKEQLKDLPGVIEVRGRGLMIGIEMSKPVAELRKKLLYDHHIFTGSSSDKNVIRLLPPLTIGPDEIAMILKAFKEELS